MSTLFKASLLLTVFFGLDKVVALLRQVVIVRQFGLTPGIDAFNVANNFPDLIVALISGGALSFAFIPILSQHKQNFGLQESWKLFSHIANMVFLTTALLSLVLAILAEPIVKAQWGIAPGFSLQQQALTVTFLRLDLIAALIFSISGLIMASLHANKHFLLPALAPILYNVGQIFGAAILSPSMSLHLGPIVLPAFNLGIYGLAYGVIIGAILHLVIQIPGILHYQFRWSPVLDFKDEYVQKVLALMGPRILTVLFFHLIFVARGNLASRLETGAVSALTYAYFIMQIPETLIGTAIGTALLPTLSDLKAGERNQEFETLLNRTIKIMLATCMVFFIVISLAIGPLIANVFNFTPHQAGLLIWTTRAYMLGLVGHSLLEAISRAYYARRNAKIPLIATFSRAVLFLVLAIAFLNSSGVIGLAFADSIAVTLELVILLVILQRQLPNLLRMSDTLLRIGAGCIVSALLMIAFLRFMSSPTLILVVAASVVSGLTYLLFIWPELKVLVKL